MRHCDTQLLSDTWALFSWRGSLLLSGNYKQKEKEHDEVSARDAPGPRGTDQPAVRTRRPRAPSPGKHLLYTSSRAVQDTIPASFLADTVYQPASSFVAPWMSRHT